MPARPGGEEERPARAARRGRGARPKAEAHRSGLRAPKAADAPRRAQEAAAQPRPGSHSSRLPFPLSPAPRGPAGPGRPRLPSPHRPPGFPQPAPAPGTPARQDGRKGGARYLSSPGLNRSPSPPSPPRSAITDSRVHPPADPASPIGPKGRQSHTQEVGLPGIYKMIGEPSHQS